MFSFNNLIKSGAEPTIVYTVLKNSLSKSNPWYFIYSVANLDNLCDPFIISTIYFNKVKISSYDILSD